MVAGLRALVRDHAPAVAVGARRSRRPAPRAAAIPIELVIPHFNHGASSSFYSRYGDVGGSPGGILQTAVTHPLRVLETAFEHRGVHYLLELFAAARRPLARRAARARRRRCRSWR